MRLVYKRTAFIEPVSMEAFGKKGKLPVMGDMFKQIVMLMSELQKGQAKMAPWWLCNLQWRKWNGNICIICCQWVFLFFNFFSFTWFLLYLFFVSFLHKDGSTHAVRIKTNKHTVIVFTYFVINKSSRKIPFKWKQWWKSSAVSQELT